MSSAKAQFSAFLSAPMQPVGSHCFLIGGLLLALLYPLLGLGLLTHQDITSFKELSGACAVTGLGLADCHAEALAAARAASGAAALVLVVTVLSLLRRPSQAQQNTLTLVSALSAGAMVLVLSAHYIARASHDVQLSRISAIEGESFFISLENLLWPLLLQGMAATRSRKLYLLLLLVVFNTAVLTPFRGVLLSFLIFGVAIPLTCICARRLGQGLGRITRRELAGLGLATTIALLFVGAIVQDSSSRTADSSNSKHPTIVAGELTPRQHAVQRATYPFYQAVMAEYVSSFSLLPNLSNEFRARLRLPDSPTFNQVLYRRLYESNYGQTTALFYGEGAAYSTGSAFFWCIAAPLLLVAGYMTISRLGLAVGLLFGVAAWRASMSGLFNLLPSLLLQLLLLISCHLLEKIGRSYVAKR